MEKMELEVTQKHAFDGQPEKSDCCAIAMALKETYYPEEHIKVQVNSDGSVDVYTYDYMSENKEDLCTLYPENSDEEDRIVSFIGNYDDIWDTEEDYLWEFPYNFKFTRKV